MKSAEVLGALTLRRVANWAAQLVASAEGSGGFENLFRSCPPHAVAEALRTSLRRAWMCLEFILCGEDVWSRVQARLTEDDGNVLRSFLLASSFQGGHGLDEAGRNACWKGLQEARRSGLLDTDRMALPTAMHLSIYCNSMSEWNFRHEEWQELERLRTTFDLSGHAELRPILELRWHGRDPLVIVLASAIFRHALEKDHSRFGNGQAGGLRDGVEQAGVADGRELADLLDRQERVLAQCLDAARSQTGDVESAAAAARLERGSVCLQRGEHERAIAEFTAALALNPSLAAAYVQRAEARRLTGDYEAALRDYDNAHLLDPSDPRVRFHRGMVQWLLGRIEAALDDFSACVGVDPSNALAWLQRGTAYADKDEFTLALADFTQALQLDPASSLAYQKRGDVYLRLGESERALADYNQAAKRNPFCSLTCIKRGDAYRALGEYDRALADYSAALRLDPLNANGYLSRASTYRLRGQLDLSLRDLHQAVRLDGNNSRLWFERALVYRALNQLEPAVHDFDRALELSPSDPEVLLQRGCTHQLNGDLDNALADFDAVLRRKPHSALAYHSRGSLQVSRGHVDEGIADFGSALRCDPAFGQAYLSRASAWSKMGRFDKAVRDCDDALRQDPELIGAYVIRAGAYVQQGAYEKAAEDITRALAHDPNNTQAYYLRGMAAMKQGRYDEALSDFNASLRLNPKNARVWFLRGTLHQHREEHNEALHDFQQAVLNDPSYTATYCNQRALVHLAKGDHELALADYAIVLQLDKTNVTALLGREQALQGLSERNKGAAPPLLEAPIPAPSKEHVTPSPGNTSIPLEQMPAPAEPRSGRRKRRSKTDPHLPARTEVLSTARKTDTFPVLPDTMPTPETTVVRERAASTLQQPVLEPMNIPELAAASLIDAGPLETPSLSGQTAPDSAVPAPTVSSHSDLALSPLNGEGGDTKPKPVGPMEARTLREQKKEQSSERAKLWAEMRYRERMKEQKNEEYASPHESGSSADTRLLRRTLVVLLAFLLLGSLGYGAYVLIAERDFRLTAEEAWKEYAKDTAAANKKYKGRFVQVKGKLQIAKTEKGTRYYFEGPSTDSKWAISFLPQQKDAQKLQEGQEITIRGRFLPRKEPEGNLEMSNCSLVNATAKGP